MATDPNTCAHRYTRPTAVDDPRPYCVSCLTVLTAEYFNLRA